MLMDVEDKEDFPDRTDLMILPWVSIFPGSLLPLYIFEERYREMTKAALAGNRMFAIAHTYDDTTIAPIGGLGVIRACVTNDDGTSNLVLQGLSRIEFSGFKNTPRPHANIRILRDEQNDSDLAELRSRILNNCEELIAEGLETQNGFADYLHSQISDSAFADLIASTLITDSIHRRTLFETIDLEARMSLLLEMLGSAAEST
jgi:Lon protease-like protein